MKNKGRDKEAMSTVISNLISFARAGSRYIKRTEGVTGAELYRIRKEDTLGVLSKMEVELSFPDKSAFEANGPSIYVGNHTSMLDALFVYASFEIDIRILAKDSLFDAPYVGRILTREKHIRVHRGVSAAERNKSIRESIHDALAEGASIMIFPEGTRSTTGKLGPFKHGAFYNAIQNNVHVVPVVIHGGFETMPKSTLRIRPGKCSLELLDPIDPPDESLGDEATRADIFAKLARDAIEAKL